MSKNRSILTGFFLQSMISKAIFRYIIHAQKHSQKILGAEGDK